MKKFVRLSENNTAVEIMVGETLPIMPPEFAKLFVEIDASIPVAEFDVYNPTTNTFSKPQQTEKQSAVIEIARIQNQLNDIDGKKVRALTDALLSNNTTQLTKLENDAQLLRDRLKVLSKI